MASTSATPQNMLSLNERGSELIDLRTAVPATSAFIGATSSNSQTVGYPT